MDEAAARLKARGDALRQAAALPGAGLRPLLEAAFAELDGAVAALADADDRPAGELSGEPDGGPYAERRLLQAVFQQIPVPLFLLGLDGTVRRANSAAGRLVGSGPGYATGKPFTAFIDLPARAAVQSQVAAVIRTGGIRTLRCGVLTAGGVAECEVAAGPVQVRGDAGQLIVAVGAPGPALAGTVLAGTVLADTVPEAEAGTGPEPPRDQPGDRALQSAIRRLDLVTSATRILAENVKHSESVTMQRFARLLARELDAWLILDVERHQRLRRQLAVGPEDQPSDELARTVAAVDPPDGSAPAQVHESGHSLLVAHAEELHLLGDGPDGMPLLMRLGATSVLCVPLSDGEQRYGVLTLARLAGHGPFGLADVGLAEELGEQLALAMRADRILRHRTEIADALQASLLPRQPRQIPGAEIAAGHAPATRARDAGGDFYDIYPALGGWGVSIGDVCGRGQDAAAVTAAARHAIRVLAHWDADPAGVLRSANEIMMEEEFGGRFVTASVSHLRWQDGRLHVVLGSAGHPWPVLVRPDGRTEMLPGGGLPLGIFPDAEPATHELDLDPGDLLFFFTDGLTSACGPDMVYFEDRITDELAALGGEPAGRVVSRLQEVVLQFCRGELRDDVTMLALRAGDPPAG
jgi:serine phosphatase RsbU (regulator of sigma subunit)/PAS domain-containing protein